MWEHRVLGSETANRAATDSQKSVSGDQVSTKTDVFDANETEIIACHRVQVNFALNASRVQKRKLKSAIFSAPEYVPLEELSVMGANSSTSVKLLRTSIPDVCVFPALFPNLSISNRVDNSPNETQMKDTISEYLYTIDSIRSVPVIVSSSIFRYLIDDTRPPSLLVRIQIYLPKISIEEDTGSDSPVHLTQNITSVDGEARAVKLHAFGWSVVVNSANSRHPHLIRNIVCSTATDGSSVLVSLEGKKHLLAYNEIGSYDFLVSHETSSGSCSASLSYVSSDLTCVGYDLLCDTLSRPVIASLSGQRTGKFYVMEFFIPIDSNVAVSFKDDVVGENTDKTTCKMIVYGN